MWCGGGAKEGTDQDSRLSCTCSPETKPDQVGHNSKNLGIRQGIRILQGLLGKKDRRAGCCRALFNSSKRTAQQFSNHTLRRLTVL